MTLRHLDGFDELLECVALQKETWGDDFDDVVSAATMLVVQKTGGVVAGAFDVDGSLAGAVVGFTGMRAGVPIHWSHMLAVRSHLRNRGIGRRLKLFQRDDALRQGIDVVYWTFDPLQAGNAYFNLNRLGATVTAYERDLYGEGKGLLHGGLGTDRFIVAWHLRSTRVADALGGRLAPLPAPAASCPIALPDRPAAGPFVRIEIPRDVQALKVRAPAEASAWRARTRRLIEHYTGEGYRVDRLLVDADEGRCYYLCTLPE